MPITINVGSLITDLTEMARMNGLKSGLKSGAAYLQTKLAEYPAESHRPQPFKTDKQRKAFFAMLRAGEIEVPYRRGSSPGSQQLGRSWQTSESRGGLTVTIGTGVSYAHYVQGEGRQATYHRVTGWQTQAQVGRQHAPRVFEIIKAGVGQDFR